MKRAKNDLFEKEFLQSAKDGNVRKFNKCVKQGVNI